VWDREFGFLREMLAAPVSRSAIVIGKCLGATVSTLQGIVILRLAGLAGVPRNPILILTVIGELLLLTYAGYPMRQAVFSHLTVSPTASAVLSPSVTRGRGPV
jgi:ABC-2 type transport system permease protein